MTRRTLQLFWMHVAILIGIAFLLYPALKHTPAPEAIGVPIQGAEAILASALMPKPQAGPTPIPTPPIQLPLGTIDGTVTLEGEVNGVSQAWTSNGDGGIVVENTFVSIVGTTGHEPTTFTLKVRYINDLFHHKVRVTGTRYKNDIIAKTVEEL